jgi:hypothetical protein
MRGQIDTLRTATVTILTSGGRFSSLTCYARPCHPGCLVADPPWLVELEKRIKGIDISSTAPMACEPFLPSDDHLLVTTIEMPESVTARSLAT